MRLVTASALPSLGSLRALAALDRCGSLTAAAHGLGVTRSALSHRIADLELQLGLALVRKSGRTLAITDEGRRLLATLGDALDRIDAAIAPFRRNRAEVRISTVATFASNWLIPRLAQFRQRHPDIAVAVSTTPRAVDLDSEDVDCAIRHGLGAWSGVTATLLFRETLVPVASPDFVSRLPRKRTPSAWLSAPLVHARSRYLDWTVWCRARSLTPPRTGGLQVENRAQARDAALAGAGTALLDAAYIGDDVAQGRLLALDATPVRLAEGYYFVCRSKRARPVTALRDWLIRESAPFRAEP